ncbi:MAG: aminoacyl-tRNA hydrolase [Bacteroidia bacterium]|nr:aminoacyl-tRNA hydrolase [Bacteroidia bacterium]
MNTEALISELSYKAVRSSGPGGQNVNKVASKVELYFNLVDSLQFSDSQKKRLLEAFKSKVNKDGVLILSCDETRSQFKNKTLVTQRFLVSIDKALKKKKVRKETKVPKSAIKKRLKHKKIQGEKKENRKKPDV